jgi:hypothetical protein
MHHRALVLTAIDQRAAEPGVSRADAITEVLDQEYAWRREELAAGQWSLLDEYVEIGQAVAVLFRRLVRRCRRRPDGQ